MSTTGRTTPGALPPLVEGQRLDRATFHTRYEAMPPGIRAELIGGVVHMPSPVGREHGRASVAVINWLGYYEEFTVGVEVLDNTTVFLGDASEPQPDAQLRILPEYGGQTRDDGRYPAGPPELVVEIARTTQVKDLGAKLADYERAGVLEYIVWLHNPVEVRWHVCRAGRLVAIPPDVEGLFRSGIFPGLWLDPLALLGRNGRRLREVLDRGIATPEHASFVDRMQTALKENIRTGLVVGQCGCGHLAPDHEYLTGDDLPPDMRQTPVDPDRAGEVIEPHATACSKCTCPKFTWSGWGLTERPGPDIPGDTTS